MTSPLNRLHQDVIFIFLSLHYNLYPIHSFFHLLPFLPLVISLFLAKNTQEFLRNHHHNNIMSAPHHDHSHRRKDSTPIEGSSSSSSRSTSHQQKAPQPLSRYESQKRRDWNTFGQYLKNQSPPVSLSHCNCNHVLDFLRYLDQFGKTKVHLHGCVFFGQPDPPAPCTCPLRQAWGSLDALIGRLRAAYEEHGGSPETNPFGNGAIRVYLREVKECQAKARGIPYKKKKKKKRNGQLKAINDEGTLKQITS